MKKIFKIFLLAIIFLGLSTGIVIAEIESSHWLYPNKIKTYIPPENKRTQMMKHAFAEWSKATNNKIMFIYVSSPQNAQLVVEFVNIVPNADKEIGLTRFYTTKTGKLVSAKIYIAEKTAKGNQLGEDAVYTVMLHEIGHAIGIAKHSTEPLSIMYPYENDKQEILKSDLKTLADIYKWE